MKELLILNEDERDAILAKKGCKYKSIYAYCKQCNEKFPTTPKRLLFSWFCKKCKISNTKRSKSTEEKLLIQEKRKATTLQKYGVDNVFKAKVVKEKSKETLQALYGVTNAQQLQVKENYIKKADKLSKIESVSYSDEDLQNHFNELQQTVKTKWDTRTREDVENIIKKRIKTNREKYGVDFAQQSEIVKQHYKENSLKRWGVENPQQSEIVRDKVEKTFRERYGSNHPNFCFVYDDQTFDSSWELAVWIWANDTNVSIKREPVKLEYEFDGKKHTYYPDFEINGSLVELKGPQFFDKDGKMVNPFDHSLDALMEAKHQFGMQNRVAFWKFEDVKPVLDYIESVYTKDYLNLFRKEIAFPYPKLTVKTDQNIIRYFHKSVYHACRGNAKSPFEAWQDKNLVKKSALNRLKYVGRCTPEDVVAGFSIAKIAPKVSVFKPNLAETLIKKYLNNFSEIFDPFSGFSGRLLGAARCNKLYIGQDINEDHVRESNEIIEFKQLTNCKVTQQNVLTDTEQNHECLFTCPPYGGKEHWNIRNDEVEKSCDEWIDICLQKYKCKCYLFVVDKTEKYKDRIVETITNRSHFGTNEEYIVLL